MTAPQLTNYIQGQGSVSGDQLNTFEQTCDNLTQLRLLIGAPGMQVFVRGFLVPQDGGGGEFYWNATSLGPDNGTTVIVPTGAATGAWIRVSLYATLNAITTVPNIAALRLMSTNPGVVFVEGYYTLLDGGEGIFVVNPSDTTTPDNGGTIIVDTVGHRWYRETVKTQPWSLKWFGAKGDTVINQTNGTVTSGTDDTGSIQNAVTAAVLAQAELYIPSGKYLYINNIIINRAIHIFGAMPEALAPGVQPFNNQSGDGTWMINNGSLVSCFYIVPSNGGSATNYVTGVEIDHIGFYYVQAPSVPNWVPTAYPATITWDGAADCEIHNNLFLNPTIALAPVNTNFAANNDSARFCIHDNFGQPVEVAVFLDRVIGGYQFYNNFWSPYWTMDTNIINFQQAFGTAYLLGACQRPTFNSEYANYYGAGVQIKNPINGNIFQAKFVDCGFNNTPQMLLLFDAQTTGHTLNFVNCYSIGYKGDGASGVSITGSGSSSFVRLIGCTIDTHDKNAVVISSTGTNNNIWLTSCELLGWNQAQAGYTAVNVSVNNNIFADSNCLVFSLPSAQFNGGPGTSIFEPPQQAYIITVPAGQSTATTPHFMGEVPEFIFATPNNNYAPATKWWIQANASGVQVYLDAAVTSAVTFFVLLAL